MSINNRPQDQRDPGNTEGTHDKQFREAAQGGQNNDRQNADPNRRSAETQAGGPDGNTNSGLSNSQTGSQGGSQFDTKSEDKSSQQSAGGGSSRQG